MTDHSLSLAVIPLMKGVVYRDGNEAAWQQVRQLQAQVRDYVEVLGLQRLATASSELAKIDQELKAVRQDIEDTEGESRRLTAALGAIDQSIASSRDELLDAQAVLNAAEAEAAREQFAALVPLLENTACTHLSGPRIAARPRPRPPVPSRASLSGAAGAGPSWRTRPPR